jgi:DNA-binding transcriptional LysR family regulator
MSVLLTRPKAGRMKVRKLTDYSLQLYASKDYLAARGPIATVDALSDHKLIGYVDDLIYSPQLRYFDDVLPGLHPGLSSPSIIAQMEMTRAGSGLCILPKFIANRHIDLVPILQAEIDVKRSFWLAIHEDVAGLARIKVLSDYLARLVKKRQAAF